MLYIFFTLLEIIVHLFFRVFSAASFAPCALSENKFSEGKEKGLLSVRYLPLASPPQKKRKRKKKNTTTTTTMMYYVYVNM